jgi:UDP-N-acetylglucosamine--N-acetylmuramyl-(pentapeptide) pyrophosphoryl-undecaprenol N-acetylglucosamine transferase
MTPAAPATGGPETVAGRSPTVGTSRPVSPSAGRWFAVIAGGGTVGHVAPALSVAAALVARGHDPATLHFVGSRRGREADLVPAAGFGITTLPGRGIVRRLSLANVAAVAGLALAALQSVALLLRHRPAVVVNLGGYASVPCTVAAALLRIPVVVVSYDAVPGAASRLAGRIAAASAVAFEGSPLRRAVVTGSPVRPEVLALDTSRAGRAATRRALDLPDDRLVLVVTSGSLGARTVNRAAIGAAAAWAGRSDLVVCHVVGKRDFASIEADRPDIPAGGLDYRPVEYEQRLPALLAAADLAVGRAGASTIAELMVLGVPSVLVPLPGAPGDHQTRNASILAAAGAAVLLPDAQCSAERLVSTVDELLADEPRRIAMAEAAAALARRDAADRIATIVEQHAKGGGRR